MVRRRLLMSCLLVVGPVVLLGNPASAHVAVAPERVAPGEAARFSFSVPNERDDVATTKVEIFLPTDAHFEFVSAQPVAGWDVTVEAGKVTWSGGSIAPHEFQQFLVTAGPVGTAPARLVFKALQTYGDGQVVRWIQLPVAGGEEPEHPAPVVVVARDEVDPPASSGSDGAARALGGVGLVVALVALAVAMAARRRSSP